MGFFETDSGCGKCKSHEECISPRLSYSGKGNKKIVILVDSPTKAEDEAGAISFNSSDVLYGSILKSIDIIPRNDCYKLAAIRCRTAKPKASEIGYCRKHLRDTLKELKPERILVFGKTALDVLVGDRISVSAYNKYIGELIPDQDLKTIIAPLYSPRYVRVNAKKLDRTEPLYRVFREQVINAINGRPLPSPRFKGYHPQIENLKKITSGTWAFDIETTGLKPYAPGHKIICIAFSDGRNNLCVDYSDEIKQELKRIFTSPDIRLIAHNLKYEDLWIREILGIQITNWYWDTMIGAHCIDNRSGITGLKHQTFVKFGVGGYEAEIAPFMKSKEKSGNAINNIESAPKDRLKLYCARDAFYTAHLYSNQFSKVPSGFFFFIEGVKELSLIESNGFRVDVERIKKKRADLKKEVAKLREELKSDLDIKKWESIEEKEFNPNSTIMLKSFFKFVGETLWKKTEKGSESVDREVLGTLSHPVAGKILDIREAEKLEGTFLLGLEEESVGDILHPTYSLHIAATYRSSASNPNSQNLPKRNKRAMRIIRKNFIPREGNVLLEVDYSGVEVRVAACYNRDPKMIEYIEDPSTDMHRDVAAQILGIDPGSVEKPWRQWAKGGFVFPAFYGSWYKQIAENMWRDVPKGADAVLKKSGIVTAIQFEKRIQEIENHFWNTRFKKYGQWKRKQWKRYLETGRVKSLTGFVYSGVMDRKEVSNYPIQGSAFHCLLASLISMNRFIRECGLKTLIIGQIHDSIILDIPEKEIPEIKKALRRIMCDELRERFPWIIVPLDIDADAGENWYEMNEVEI